MADKIVTLSFDDGPIQDVRFIEMLNKYNIKATFNLNSEFLGLDGTKVKKEDVRTLYSGHEVAGHTLTHPLLPATEKAEIIRQVEVDRLNLSELAGYEVIGFAYPCGGVNFNREVADIIKNNTGVKYARTIKDNFSFVPQTDLYVFEPTVRPTADYNKFFEITEKFLTLNCAEPSLFYVWGHTFEFDMDNSWGRFEEWCKLISSAEDISFCTNKEAFEKLR